MVSLKNGKKSRLARNGPFSQILSQILNTAILRVSALKNFACLCTMWRLCLFLHMCLRFIILVINTSIVYNVQALMLTMEIEILDSIMFNKHSNNVQKCMHKGVHTYSE